MVGIAKGADIAFKGATGGNELADGLSKLAIANFDAIEPLAQREENVNGKGFFGFALLGQCGEKSVGSGSHGGSSSVNNN